MIGAVVAENLLIAGAALGVLVAISTLMIRIVQVVDNRIESAIAHKQAEGDLPTKTQMAHIEDKLDEIRDALNGY